MLRVAVLILFALVFGGVTGWATLVVQQRATESALAEYEQQLVWVLVDDVEAGEELRFVIREGRVEQQPFPIGFLPDGAVLDMDGELEDTVASRSLPAGSLLLRGDFVEPQPTLARDYLTSNEVAVALELPEANRGGGLVTAGSQVGVMVSSEAPDTGEILTTVLFQSLTVLAAEGRVIDEGVLSEIGLLGDTTIALAVPADQVARLLNAYATGDISIVLLQENQTLPRVQRG
jgi:Flp pilus assembly protein CpaB